MFLPQIEDDQGSVSDGEADSVEGGDDAVRLIPQYFVSNGLVQTHTTRKSMKGRDYMEVWSLKLPGGFCAVIQCTPLQV